MFSKYTKKTLLLVIATLGLRTPIRAGTFSKKENLVIEHIEHSTKMARTLCSLTIEYLNLKEKFALKHQFEIDKNNKIQSLLIISKDRFAVDYLNRQQGKRSTEIWTTESGQYVEECPHDLDAMPTQKSIYLKMMISPQQTYIARAYSSMAFSACPFISVARYVKGEEAHPYYTPTGAPPNLIPHEHQSTQVDVMAFSKDENNFIVFEQSTGKFLFFEQQIDIG